MNKFFFVAGKVLAVIFTGIAVAFLIGLAALKMVPTVVLLVVGCVLAVLLGAVLFLTWTGHGKVKMIIGVVLAVAMITTLSVGSAYVYKTLDTLDKISNVKTETVHMGIYVSGDNVYADSSHAAGYRYGILRNLDRDNTDQVLEKMSKAFGAQPTYQAYENFPELLEALFNKQVDAIVLNQAYLDLLEEMKGYEDIRARIRELFMEQIEVEIEPSPETKPTNPENISEQEKLLKPFILYITGIDAYGSVSVRSRSDVNILAVVNPKTHQVALVSTPRDYYVPLSISNGIPDKLTHAGIYGVNVSMETLEMLYDIEIDYYFRVNFSGFTKLIDALGGITVYSAYSFSTKQYTYEKGLNTMDGKKALAFCRERYAFSAGDRQRGRNQMAVIQAVIDKALSPALLTKYTQVMDAVIGTFETNMPMEIIGAITSQQLNDDGQWNIVTCSADGIGDNQIPYSMSFSVYVMQPDYKTVERAKTLMQNVYNGEIIDPDQYK